MKKLIIITILAVSFPWFPIFAATTDFTANSDITVSDVTFGASTADMTIFNGSASESWTFNAGTFSVTNPDTAFKIGSSDSSVKAIKATRSGSDVACSENTTPGTSYLTLPTISGVYTISPLTITDCDSLCASVDNAATYNSFPTCGAASCNSGYNLSGSGSNATCVAASTGGGGGIILTSYCVNVEYGEWQEACINGLQYRNVISNNCNLTVEQENLRKRKCNQQEPVVEQMQKEIIAISDDKLYLEDAQMIFKAMADELILILGIKERNPEAESLSRNTLFNKLKIDLDKLKINHQYALTNFIAYGSPATKKLGWGERAGVINSFRSAFGKIPETESDWQDIVKIANGRWTNQRNDEAENSANLAFKKVYLRSPDRSNPHDDAAVTIIAYGLRPMKRNLDSERAAIRIFASIYGNNPSSVTDWDVVRAIAYSGAIR